MKRVAIVALVMLTVTLSAASVFAQGSTPGQTMGILSVSGNGTAYMPNITVVPGTPFDLFILAELDYGDIGRPSLNASTGLRAWEAGLTIPSSFLIAQATIRNVALNLGTPPNTDFLVGLTTAIIANTTPIDLVQYSIVFFGGAAPTDLLLELGQASQSSFNPPAAGFNDNIDVGECINLATGGGTECLRPFAVVRPAVVNCVNNCITPVETPSWGAIKANFGD